MSFVCRAGHNSDDGKDDFFPSLIIIKITYTSVHKPMLFTNMAREDGRRYISPILQSVTGFCFFLCLQTKSIKIVFIIIIQFECETAWLLGCHKWIWSNWTKMKLKNKLGQNRNDRCNAATGSIRRGLLYGSSRVSCCCFFIQSRFFFLPLPVSQNWCWFFKFFFSPCLFRDVFFFAEKYTKQRFAEFCAPL